MALGSLNAVPVGATMQLERNIIYFNSPDQSRIDIQVTNPDDETLYVEVEVLEVKNPGTDQETRTPIRDPRQIDFLVTPNKFIIPPGVRKLVRFVNTGGLGETERIFRVNLKPVSPPMEATQNAIRLVVGYQVLVLISPENPEPDLVAIRNGKKLTVANHGNRNVLFRNGVQCPTEADLDARNLDRCDGVEVRRVYPGNVWSVDLKHDAPVEFTLSEGGAARRERF
jgi:P pilus assembly chaperone PapD